MVHNAKGLPLRSALTFYNFFLTIVQLYTVVTTVHRSHNHNRSHPGMHDEGVAERLAERLRVPAARRPAFLEIVAAQGERGAKHWEAYLSKVRSHTEVAARIDELADSLGIEKDSRAWEKLVFCGRYSAKAGTALDDALQSAADGIRRAASTSAGAQAALGGPIRFKVVAGRFGDEHLRCREHAFPYKPSVSARHGSAVLHALATEAISGLFVPGQLLGYVAVQTEGYIDDVSVFPEFQGHGVASACLAAAGAIEAASGRRNPTLSLDVRAANVPAIRLYKSLGFRFGTIQHVSHHRILHRIPTRASSLSSRLSLALFGSRPFSAAWLFGLGWRI